MMFGMGFGGFGLGWLVMVLFWVFVVAGIAWLVLAASRATGTTTPGRGGAASILAERYARGEIDSEEFKARTRAIEEASR